MIYRNLCAALALFAISACTSPKEKSLEQIKSLEARDSVFSPQNIEDLKEAYLDFSAKYPDDEASPEFIFKAAQRCNVMAQHEEALKLFGMIIEKYPKSRVSEEALFLQGYIYENSLQNYPEAKKVYLAFIEKYPNSELTEDARYAVQHLGQSPEEVFENFSKSDSAGINQ